MTQITLNAFELFAAIGNNADFFAELDAEIEKVAARILLKRIKAKNLDVSEAQKLRRIVGIDNFKIALDQLDDKDIARIVKRLDPHHAKFEDPHDLREHLDNLAANRTKVASKPLKPVKVAASKRVEPKETTGWPKSMVAKSPKT